MRERAGGVFAALPDTLLSASLVRRPEADAATREAPREEGDAGVGAPSVTRELPEEGRGERLDS